MSDVSAKSARQDGTSPAAPANLSIGSGDLLQVSVFGAPDFNAEVRVAEDGTVSLPLIGAVAASGMTAQQFAKVLKERLSTGGYFNNPQVSIFVKEYATKGVSVLGEVQKPGIYPLLGPRKLYDVISAAQGTTQLASNRVTLIHRDRPEQPQVIKLAYGEQGSRESNVAVLPGDTVVVEKAGTMYVVGNVQKPTEIVMANPDLTVLQAIAMAQGISPGAALDKAKLVRKTPEGPKEIPLPLKKMLAGKAPDQKVEPNDVVFVPSSAAKGAAKRGLEAALQTITGLAVYGRY
ncbi:MAG: polysaccharide biosynthesis/export family protein [Terriglobales bacterium]